MPGVHVNVVKKCRKTPVVKYYLVSLFFPYILLSSVKGLKVLV